MLYPPESWKCYNPQTPEYDRLHVKREIKVADAIDFLPNLIYISWYF